MSRSNIEADRRSAVSSFYGGRKTSIDMLNDDPGLRGNLAESRHDQSRDDASSFYGMQRGGDQGRVGSSDMLVGQRPSNGQSGGYNRNSYFNMGREEPVKGLTDEEEEFMGSRRDLGAVHGAGEGDEQGGWNVFADFNNFGPRYSTAFNNNNQASGYQQVEQEALHTPTKVENSGASTASGPVELVTVPALGAEWKKSEMEAMTKRGRKKQKDSHRMDNFRAWRRDQRGCCGKYGTRRQIAVLLFVLCVIIGLILAFTIPRVPSFTFASTSPLLNGTGTETFEFSRSPANFSFNALLDLRADSSTSFLPTKFNNITATVLDQETDESVASGSMSLTVPAKQSYEFKLPLEFSYVASNDSDVTWNDFYDACRNEATATNGVRSGVNLRVEFTLSIAGLIGYHKKTLQISDVACPFELSQDSV